MSRFAAGTRGDYIELSTPAGVKPGERVFRKQILDVGTLKAPGGYKVPITRRFAEDLKRNLFRGEGEAASLILADRLNRHTDEPDRAIGRVIDVETEDDKIFVKLAVAKHADDLGATIHGASVMVDENFEDDQGVRHGPTLLHVLATNRPWKSGMEPYQEVIAASADTSGEVIIMTSHEVKEGSMGLDEILAALKADHGIDVPALQAAAKKAEERISLSSEIMKALSDKGVLALSAPVEQATDETAKKAVAELGDRVIKLSSSLEGLLAKDAEREVERLIDAGYIVPKDDASRAQWVQLKLSAPTMFDSLIPDKPLIKLSVERGLTPPDQQSGNIDDEIKRLAKLHHDLAKGGE